MLSSSPITPIQLMWVKSKIKGRHELTASGPILGSLQRVGFWKNASQAEFEGKTWSFQRTGFARTAILEGPSARPVAQFKAHWLGGGVLTFNDGESFQLTGKGFWRPIWSWLDSLGNRLLEVIPHDKTVRVTGAEEAQALNSVPNSPTRAAFAPEFAADSNSHAASAREWIESKLPVLIMFSWHQILQTNDDAAAAAAISAAAAG
jgi:hypothetical protein